MPRKSRADAQAELAARVTECVSLREQGRTLYARSDEILDELVATIDVGTSCTLPDGRTATLVDQFADGKSVVWKPAGVRRFDLRVK